MAVKRLIPRSWPWRCSGVGVTFVGATPQGRVYQFRWKLYGFPGWTCYGDGSGFPERGAGGDCSKGGGTVEWYHAESDGPQN